MNRKQLVCSPVTVMIGKSIQQPDFFLRANSFCLKNELSLSSKRVSTLWCHDRDLCVLSVFLQSRGKGTA